MPPRQRFVVTEINWSKRVRNYRRGSNLTQEQLATIFGVETRTVQRWEAGASRPTDRIQRELVRAPVPPIVWPTVRGLMSLVETSSEYVLLLDEKLRVLANSKSHKIRMMSQFGTDVVGHEWTKYMPQVFADMIEREGGRDAIYRRGYSSLTADYHRQINESSGNKFEAWGRAAQSVLRLDGGIRIELCMARDIPKEEYILGNPVITYIDDILADG
jgi:transcriptional regulator with XRE-family HTH domain